jgi:hypothetical protein
MSKRLLGPMRPARPARRPAVSRTRPPRTLGHNFHPPTTRSAKLHPSPGEVARTTTERPFTCMIVDVYVSYHRHKRKRGVRLETPAVRRIRSRASRAGVAGWRRCHPSGEASVSPISRSRTRQLRASRADFLFVFKAARNGPHAPPIGHLAAAAAVAPRRPGPRPPAGADSEKPPGPPKNGQHRGPLICLGRQSAGR